MSILSKFFSYFTTAASKNGVTMMKDGKPLTEQEIETMGSTADAHEALSEAFAQADSTREAAIANLEQRIKAAEEKQAAQDSKLQTIEALQAKITQLEAAATTAADKLQASEKQITELAQHANKGKTTPLVSTPSTPDDANKMVEKQEVDEVVGGYQDLKLRADMEKNAQIANANKKIFPIT